jgi:hypothetical protein
MRIQETNQIMKEARNARHEHSLHTAEESGVMSRLTKVVSNMTDKISGLFRKTH